MFEELLIKLVKTQVCLYDKRNPGYRNVNLKERTWHEIGRKLNVDVTKCKKRWKSLRDRFQREDSKQEDKTQIIWRYYPALSFLRGISKSKSTVNMKYEMENTTFDMDGDSDQKSKAFATFDFRSVPCGNDENEEYIEEDETCIETVQQQKMPYNENISYKRDRRSTIHEDLSDYIKIASRSKPPQSTVEKFFQYIASKVEESNLPLHVRGEIEEEVLALVNSKIKQNTHTLLQL